MITMIVNDHANTFTTSHTDSEHAECGGVLSLDSDISLIYTGTFARISNGHISKTPNLIFLKFGRQVEHDFRRLLLDFWEN